MWCKKCHYGSISYNFDHCGQCGSTELEKKNPLPQKPIRSIRAMAKRKDKKSDKKKPTDETIEKMTQSSFKARDYQQFK